MTGNQLHPRDRWFEDWAVGDVASADRTYVMTEERMIEFAREFDPQPFHTDPEAAVDSVFGGLVASGWHTSAAMMRLITTLLGPSSMGAAGIDELRWPTPVRAGDELRLTSTVLEKRVSESKPDRGIMRVRQELHNQGDELVFSCVSIMLLRTRSGT